MRGIAKLSLSQILDYSFLLSLPVALTLSGKNIASVSCESVAGFIKLQFYRISAFYFVLAFFLGQAFAVGKEGNLFKFLQGNNINIRNYFIIIFSFIMLFIFILNIPFWLKERFMWEVTGTSLSLKRLVYSDILNYLTFALFLLFLLLFVRSYVLFLALVYTLLILDLTLYGSSGFPIPFIFSHAYADYLGLIGNYGWLYPVLLGDIVMGVMVWRFWRHLL